MRNLNVNGHEITTIPELRSDFDLDSVAAAYLDGSLTSWLEDNYYEKEHALVSSLQRRDTPKVRRLLCEIFNVEYAVAGALTAEEKTRYAEKLTTLNQYTNDPTTIVHVRELATNQAELVDLIQSELDEIYLCEGPFSIPIRKGDIHYIGVGNPKIESAFTQAQYEKVDITFEGVVLPENADNSLAFEADSAAQAHGYDFYYEENNPLACRFHHLLKHFRLDSNCTIIVDGDEQCEMYHSKLKAELTAKRLVETVYKIANNTFTPGTSECVARELAKRYAEVISNLSWAVEQLKGHYDAEKISDLSTLISNAESNLSAAFDEELRDSADYYAMYKKEYFLDLIEVEDHGGCFDLFENEHVNRFFGGLLHDTPYSIWCYKAIDEIQKDVDTHASTFFDRAYEEYKSYCRKIERIAEEIGDNISVEVLKELKLI